LIADLDEEVALDPERVGAKAAVLARARRAGVPVLPGFVVESSASLRHMEIGAGALQSRGSGGARLAMIAEPAPEAGRIEAAGEALGTSLVARSSTRLENAGEWAGAFTSYLGIAPEELPRAVVGCWASAFSVDALGRQEAAGLEPGSIAMAVLVQPAIGPSAGGVAELDADGSLVVGAVAGSPVPLLQGWERGSRARWAHSKGWEGGEAIDLIGVGSLDALRAVLEDASARFGVNRLEWALDERLWILQLGTVARPGAAAARARSSTTPDLIPTVQAIMTAPGVLGSELVLPWALAGMPGMGPPRRVGGEDLVDRALEMSGRLTSRVWDMPPETASREARKCLRRLRGPDPAAEIATIRGLNRPDRDQASHLLSLIHEMGTRLAEWGVIPQGRSVWHLSPAELRRGLGGEIVAAPGRVGVGRWEPLVAAVVLDHGSIHRGIPAAGGIGAGVRFHVDHTAMVSKPPQRAVITSPHAPPNLSQLVWDAAGLVTHGGSASAHLFESARSLGVPAVCGVEPGADRDQIIAVDGYSGLVATLPLSSDP